MPLSYSVTFTVALASSSLETGVVNGTDEKNAPVIIKPVEALCMTAYSPSNKPAIGHDGKEGHDAEEGTLFRPKKMTRSRDGAARIAKIFRQRS